MVQFTTYLLRDHIYRDCTNYFYFPAINLKNNNHDLKWVLPLSMPTLELNVRDAVVDPDLST